MIKCHQDFWKYKIEKNYYYPWHTPGSNKDGSPAKRVAVAIGLLRDIVRYGTAPTNARPSIARV
jgi:hypothetical protein